MRSTPFPLLARIFVLVLSISLVGCNALGITGDDDDENEVNVTITQVGADFLVASDGITYEVTADTDFDGVTGLADLAVGQAVEIEWAAIPNSANRLALEVEFGDDD